jgi:hypothetical protein
MHEIRVLPNPHSVFNKPAECEDIRMVRLPRILAVLITFLQRKVISSRGFFTPLHLYLCCYRVSIVCFRFSKLD